MKGVLGSGVSRSKGKVRKYRICSGSYALRGGFFCSSVLLLSLQFYSEIIDTHHCNCFFTIK